MRAAGVVGQVRMREEAPFPEVVGGRLGRQAVAMQINHNVSVRRRRGCCQCQTARACSPGREPLTTDPTPRLRSDRYDARVRGEASDRRPVRASRRHAPADRRRGLDARRRPSVGRRLPAASATRDPFRPCSCGRRTTTATPYYTDQARFFTQHGYAFVIQDCRGKFNSGGEFRPWFNEGRRRLRHPAVGRHAALVRRQRRHGRVLVRRRDAVAGGAARQSASARDGACRRPVGLLGAGPLRRRRVRARPEPLVGRPERGPQPARTHAARDPAIVVAPAAGHGRCRGRHRHPVVPGMARPPGVRRLLADDRNARALLDGRCSGPQRLRLVRRLCRRSPRAFHRRPGERNVDGNAQRPSGSSWGRGTT